MSRVEQIEGQVRSLNADDLKAFRDWFVHYEAACWDQKIEADAKNGKLNSLAESALRDHGDGRSTEL